MVNAMNDLRFALRQLRKSPGFTLIAVLTLGARDRREHRDFQRHLCGPAPAAALSGCGSDDDRYRDRCESAADFGFVSGLRRLETRQHNVFDELALSRRESFNLSGLPGRAPEQISGALVTANFFKVIGLTPQLGRVFTEEEDRVGGPLVAVISDRLWQRVFSRDPNVLGRAVNFGNQPYTIIGVMPPQMFSPRTVEVWFPVMRRTDNPAWQTRDNHPGLFGWGRLKQGVTREEALNELKQIAARLAKQYPDSNTGGERDGDSAAGKSSGRLSRQSQLCCSARSRSFCSSLARIWPTCSRLAARRGPGNSRSAPRWERRAGKSFASS